MQFGTCAGLTWVCGIAGWKGARCEVDVDECAEGKVSCGPGECRNLDGSYKWVWLRPRSRLRVTIGLQAARSAQMFVHAGLLRRGVRAAGSVPGGGRGRQRHGPVSARRLVRAALRRHARIRVPLRRGLGRRQLLTAGNVGLAEVRARNVRRGIFSTFFVFEWTKCRSKTPIAYSL